MDIIEFCDFCDTLPLNEPTTPFDEDTLVNKVGGKMYTLSSIGDFKWVVVKCDPEVAAEFCERYPEIEPAYHMNKRHWISIDVNGGVPDSFVQDRIRDSYRLVVRGISPRAKRDEIVAVIESVYPDFFSCEAK